MSKSVYYKVLLSGIDISEYLQDIIGINMDSGEPCLSNDHEITIELDNRDLNFCALNDDNFFVHNRNNIQGTFHKSGYGAPIEVIVYGDNEYTKKELFKGVVVNNQTRIVDQITRLECVNFLYNISVDQLENILTNSNKNVSNQSCE